MTKKILAFVLVAVILVAAWFVYKNMKKSEPLSSEVAATLDISEVSLEGKVLAMGKDYVTVRAGRVQRTDQGNVLAAYDKTVLFTDDDVAKDSLAKLKVGDTAVFYGTGADNPPEKEDFLANRVEVLGR